MYLLYADHGIQMPLNKIPKTYSETRWLVRPKHGDVMKHSYCHQAQKTLVYLNYININILLIQFR